MRRLYPWLVAMFLVLPVTAEAQAAPVATIDTGALAGSAVDGISVFRGIPYAAPPVGDLRWRAPRAAATWPGLRDATRFGDDCLQTWMPDDVARSGQPMSEDCLYANVWTAGAGTRPHGLPVMVWIYGGGFVNGSGASPIYDGARLARRGLVVVTFNYRIGRLGFFAHPALTREAAGAPTGNWGLMDQIAALKWVKRNIAAFGGDPDRVTIFGESAGGESVNRLMASPVTHGLFERAISSSGGGRDKWPGLAAAEAVGVAFAKSAGARDDAASLRAIPAAVAAGKITMLARDEGKFSGAITDGQIVTDSVDAVFASGAEAKVPYIVGANSDELGFVPAIFRSMVTSGIVKPLGDVSAVKAAYGDAFERRIAGDVLFVEPSIALARRHAANGAPTWLYRFGYVAEAARRGGKGAPHASDVPFEFDTLEATKPAPSAADQAAATMVADYWSSFARAGDPNHADAPAWSRFTATAPQMLAIGTTGAVMQTAGDPALAALAQLRDGAVVEKK